jgi:hypothetical protein
MLHAWRLGFFHPATQQRHFFEAPVPGEFQPWLDETALALLDSIRKTEPERLPDLLKNQD